MINIKFSKDKNPFDISRLASLNKILLNDELISDL